MGLGLAEGGKLKANCPQRGKPTWRDGFVVKTWKALHLEPQAVLEDRYEGWSQKLVMGGKPE